ncbi:hypothetical protein A2160_04620 [Candidatus Beckwithbacteria bacterium RBG_13_42_9]|uniref:Uncharacterized protein n=1 Tax=Candidatus Beckwithbacteria bacterium RBG_13_42_9 TaxID=1797457 RepID=A0A1F5E3Z7_9BACT|nr:MAG: hypothetical protein A2160_04620 [Candidatus Beckwithbacteria bacterium RBG_13_42_9]
MKGSDRQKAFGQFGNLSAKLHHFFHQLIRGLTLTLLDNLNYEMITDVIARSITTKQSLSDKKDCRASLAMTNLLIVSSTES